MLHSAMRRHVEALWRRQRGAQLCESCFVHVRLSVPITHITSSSMLRNVSNRRDANRTRHKKYNFVFEDMAGDLQFGSNGFNLAYRLNTTLCRVPAVYALVGLAIPRRVAEMLPYARTCCPPDWWISCGFCDRRFQEPGYIPSVRLLTSPISSRNASRLIRC